MTAPTNEFTDAYSTAFDPAGVESIRERIAAAVAGIEIPGGHLDGQPNEPVTIAMWAAWPIWTGTEWITRCGLEHTWHVIVILPPGDARTWNPAADRLLNPIRDALEAQLGHVTRAEPVTVAAGDASTVMPALRFHLTTPTAT